MLPVITVKEGKERKEGKKDITSIYFFQCMCRGGGKCVLSGIEDNNTKKFSLQFIFSVCQICFSTCLLKTKTQIAFLF